MSADRLDELWSREQIREVLYRYCHGVDRLERDIVASCYHPDATDDHGSFSGGIDAYLDWSFGLLARYSSTSHVLHNISIEVQGDVAHVQSAGVARHHSDDPAPHRNLITGFRYLDRFERRAGEWRIAVRTAVTDWSEVRDSSRHWDVPDHFLQGGRGAADPSHGFGTD